MKLRFADAGDVPECVEIGREFWKSAPYNTPYNPEAVGHLLGRLIENELFVVAEYEEEIVGVAGIAIVPLPFDPSIRVAQELFWYVRPGVRENGVGEALLSNLEAVARAKGATIFGMGTMKTSNPTGAEALLFKNGYKQTEKTYTKAL